MRLVRKPQPVHLFFFVALILNGAFAASAWDMRARWANVPPVPSLQAISMQGLGDYELVYRFNGMRLQNMGDEGGMSSSLEVYDYKRLGEWFFLMHRLSPRSDFIPYLAAFYFGSVRDAGKAKYLAEYLEEAGQGTGRNSWRWLAQAVYIARFQVKDLDWAYRLANELANRNDPDLPAWARQMPAFILNEQGDKAAAYALLVSMMRSEVDKLPPQELNAMRDYVCVRILSPQEALKDPLCKR